MENTILFLITILSFLSYVLWVWIKFGKQQSISHSYLLLTSRQKILFTLFCWGTAIPAMLLGNSIWMFLAGSGMVFVGAAANISEKMTKAVHQVAAYSMVLFSLLAIAFQYHNYTILILWVSASLLSLMVRKYLIWWVEIITFFAIITVLFQSIS